MREQGAWPSPAERLQLALDAGAIAGTWFWDVVADRLTSDRRFAQCLSLDAARLEAGVPLAEVVQAIHPDDGPRVGQLIARALKVGGLYRAEYRVLHPDGVYRWLEANGKVTQDAAGRALTFPGVLIDIDRRKVAELKQLALLRLGDELRALDDVDAIVAAASGLCGAAMNATRAGYGVVEPVLEQVQLAPEWRRDAGITSVAGVHRFRDFGSFIENLQRGEVVAIADVEVDPRTAAFGAAFGRLGIRGLLNVPLMRNGALHGVLLVHDAGPRPWTADEIAFALGVADRTWAAIVTAQALARLRALNANLEREVQERTADRNRLWRMSRDVMLIARFDGEIVAANPAWEGVLGWSEGELVGRRLFELVHPDDRARTVDAAADLEAGEPLPAFENRYRHKGGGYRWISWSAVPDDGLIVAAGRDISAAKSLQLAEEQLRQSQKLEAVGQLTGGVAHDFNNLLTVISTSVALLRRTQTSPEQRTRSIDAISKTVSRAARLTGQLLAFARRQALTPTVFDAAVNVAAVIDMVGTLVGARVQVDTVMEDGCFINADPGQFDTAIVNLAVNARDAMDGAGMLAVSVRRVTQIPGIRRHQAVQGRFVAVSVTDTGSGISPETLERIFEPFFTTKMAGHGTGLGLSQVFGFAKQSGGDVDVDSEPGRGTTFTLYFPQVAAPAGEVARATSPGEPEVTVDGMLLVVEDNREVATAVRASLHELGYATEHADGAASALELLAAAPARFSAVFSDVVMAGMDGVALAREIRRRWPSLPVVLTSGYSHVLADDSGHGFDLLAKPYDLDALSQAIRGAVTSARDGRPIRRRAGLTPLAMKSMLDDAQMETQRQAELDSMQVLDTPPESAFDDLVRMASDLCGTPIALVSLIDRDRQWFKARVGLDAAETPREFAFCAHAIAHPDRVMVVEDASMDPRFAANPLVTGDPNIRFYAGAPLVSSAGHALGTLCVIAPTSRVLEPKEEQMLRYLADEAVKRLEQRRERLREA